MVQLKQSMKYKKSAIAVMCVEPVSRGDLLSKLKDEANRLSEKLGAQELSLSDSSYLISHGDVILQVNAGGFKSLWVAVDAYGTKLRNFPPEDVWVALGDLGYTLDRNRTGKIYDGEVG